jgi:pyruvate kinase
MRELARRGTDVVRINCTHDGADDWAAMIANTRKAAEAVGRRIPILMDIAGPKFRIGKVKRHPGERLGASDLFRLVRDAAAFSDDPVIEAVCEPADILGHLVVGTEVSFDDGKLGGVVEACQPDCVVVRVQRSQLKGFKQQFSF